MECILAGHILYQHIAHFSMECISAGHILYQHIARFGMECISAGHILYLRPSISRLSTSARPPHHPPHMHHHQKLHHHLHQHQHPNHLSISSTHRQIHFCQEKLEEVLTGTVFQFGTFCSVLLERVAPRWILWSRSGFAELTTPAAHCTVHLRADLTDIFDICHLSSNRQDNKWLLRTCCHSNLL